LPVLSQKDVTYLTELVEAVLEEVLSLRKSISDSDQKMEALSAELNQKWDFGKMVGKSPSILNLFKLLTKVSESDATILVTGENGTGKEGIARAVHFNSRRKKQNFVVQNCGALNENLLESELFGHVKGAFTSAVKDKKGLFELADKGTLFLDEIGDTSPAMQVKLLRVLQEGTFIPVGGTEQKKVDVRIVAATNKNLDAMKKNGSFREDLYYRLNVINVKVPPLRERKDDIPLLCSRFLEDYALNSNTPKKRVSKECLDAFQKYDWPGNVRELQNEIERLCVLCGDSEVVTAENVSDRLATVLKRDDKFPGLRLEGKLKDAIETLEKKMIFECLTREQWNKSRAAKELGISRAGLIMKCEKYGYDKADEFQRDAG
jgi:two-component system, NtrC family, response regulator HupR/HoxA